MKHRLGVVVLVGLTVASRGVLAQAPNPDAFYRLGPDSLEQEGVPKGEMRGPFTLPSTAYPGTQHTYWVYVPAQYSASEPASLMVFNDGQAFKNPTGNIRAHNVLDNLIHRREIPVMVAVFINPGRRPDQPEPTPQNWLMEALTKKGYDVNYAWGMNRHGQAMGGAILPEMMRWLWRDQPVSTDPRDMVERSFRTPAVKN
jgi:enterochelin esterase family protein